MNRLLRTSATLLAALLVTLPLPFASATPASRGGWEPDHDAGLGPATGFGSGSPTIPAGAASEACGPMPGVIEVCVEPGERVVGWTLRAVDVVDGQAHRAVGHLDTYRFLLPGGASVTTTCVTLVVDGAETSPCALAGGAFVVRLGALVDRTASEPAAQEGGPIASVGVCEARLTLLVLDLVAVAAPAFVVC